MRITTVKIEDFFSLGEVLINLDDKGLILVQGQNLDNTSSVSNGAGKSSLVDAIAWCLFGVTARGANPTKVIRNGAKHADVIVTLKDDDDTTYTVRRIRRATGVKLELYARDALGVGVDMTGGTVAMTEAAIVKVMGCSAEVFCSAVYVGQDAMPDLPGMTDKKLKELIEEAAGLSEIEACYERARATAVGIENNLTRAQATLSNARLNLTNAQAGHTEATNDFRDWAAHHAIRIGNAHDRAGHALLALHAAERVVNSLKPEADLVRARLLAIDEELAFFTSAQTALKKAHTEVTSASRVLAELEGVARLAVSEQRTAEEHLSHLRLGKPCDACGQNLPAASLGTLIASAEEGHAEAHRGALGAVRDVKAARERATAAQAQVTACEAAVPDVTALQEEAKKLRVHLDAYEAAVREHHTTLEAYEKSDEFAKNVPTEENPYKGTLARANTAKVTAEAAVTDAGALCDDLEGKLAQAKGVVAVFGPGGVRAEILDQVTPYLNSRTAAYLDALSDGTLKAIWTTLVRDAKGNLKEKFTIQVTHPAGEGFAELSGGEKRKVRLAAALALQDLVGSRATKPLHLFVADEIDDALDEAGLERLMGVLGDKAKEKGTVLVISHNSLTDWISNAWTIVKSGGVAVLETA